MPDTLPVGSAIGLLQALLNTGQHAAAGDPLGAIRGANSAAGALGGLANLPELSEAAGVAAGPLGLVSGILSGNPVQIGQGIVQGGSALSGALGGPTLGSLASGLASSLGGEIATMAGTGLSGGLVGGAMAAPAMMMLSALIADEMGAKKRQEMAQKIERSTYASEWPGLTRAREVGANLLPVLNQVQGTPQDLATALALSTRGIRAVDLASGYQNLQGNEGGKPNDLSAWAEKAPGLEGANWASWAALMDAANKAGIDAGAIQGASIPGPSERPSVHRHMFGFSSPTTTFQPGGSQYNPITDYDASAIDLNGGNQPLRPGRDEAGNPIMLDASTYQPGDAGHSTQEANDISNLIAGLGGRLGVDWGARGNGGENQNYTITPEQLGDYGFTSGNYLPAAMNYLRTIEPGVTSNPNWALTLQQAGLDPTELDAMPQHLAPLTGNPAALALPVTEADEIKRLFGSALSADAAMSAAP